MEHAVGCGWLRGAFEEWSIGTGNVEIRDNEDLRFSGSSNQLSFFSAGHVNITGFQQNVKRHQA